MHFLFQEKRRQLTILQSEPSIHEMILIGSGCALDSNQYVTNCYKGKGVYRIGKSSPPQFSHFSDELDLPSGQIDCKTLWPFKF